MVAYERFAAFYDVVMDDPAPRAARVDAAIDRYRPDAASLLELGCGTGSILARLDDRGDPDRARPVARRCWPSPRPRCPGPASSRGTWPSFDLGRRFDVVVCVFDSINHLLDVASWASLVECVHRHLTDGGLFVFDVNTVGELHRLGEEPPWVYDFDGGTAVIDVDLRARPGRTRRHRLGHPDLRAGDRHPLRAPPRAHRRAGAAARAGARARGRTGSNCSRRSTRTGCRPPTPRSRPTTHCGGGTERTPRPSGSRAQRRSRRPEARATGRRDGQPDDLLGGHHGDLRLAPG